MNMVSQEHIEELFVFTQKHYVEWYDLQSELVDHLANGIEHQWKVDPDLSFEKALQKEFKKFGVFGFMDVVEERQKSLGKKYSKLIWKHNLEFFKLPKIILLILFSVATFYLLRLISVSADYLSAVIVILFIGYFVKLSVSYYRERKRSHESGEKKWLFKDIIMQHGAGFGLGLIPIHFFNMIIPNTSSFADMNPWVLGSICFLFVLMCIMFYVMQVVIPKKMEEYLEETYPEYKLVK